jgi:hypothetical protein
MLILERMHFAADNGDSETGSSANTPKDTAKAGQ